MTDEQFWIAIWRTLAAVACVTTLTVGGCVARQDQLIADAVAHGADPVKMACAISPPSEGAARVTLCGAKP